MWFEWQMEGPADRWGKPIAPGFLRSALEVVLIPTLRLGDSRGDSRIAGDMIQVGKRGGLPWAKRCRLGRTTRPVRFGGLRSARRMGRKREDFWHLRRCWTGFRVKKQRGSAGWIARRCVTG